MERNRIGGVVIGLVVLCAATGLRGADEEKKAAQGPFVGVVHVERDDKEKIAGATLKTTDGTSYPIVLSGKGKSLASKEEGMTAAVEGSLVKKKVKGEDEPVLMLSAKAYDLLFSGTVRVEKKGKRVQAVHLGDYACTMNGLARDLAKDYEGKEATVVATRQTKRITKGKEKTEVIQLTIREIRTADKTDEADK